MRYFCEEYISKSDEMNDMDKTHFPDTDPLIGYDWARALAAKNN